ncbi:hypothetical protein FAZ98_31410 [Paraburkholderia acidisoli]|uniref:Uncharacterized protein n=1 Tax=Paraburkholderia acidisoli TaxID=2571748 RepID=A0A7Z2GRL9_9BURK|nr:hypothetical protein FAZ98_31410 [Paraburkholderia acidisoli]
MALVREGAAALSAQFLVSQWAEQVANDARYRWIGSGKRSYDWENKASSVWEF